jgi:hypothetical protein
MIGAPDAERVEQLIYATHPAAPKTYIVYAQKDGSILRTTVVLWGVLDDGTAVPITLSGVWDGVSNQNNFVQHPDGSCGKFEDSWETIEEAIQAVQQYAD